MSKLKVKEVLLGDNADPSKNFLIEVPAVADGTLSIKRQDGTNVLSIDATGKAVIPGVVGTVAQVGGIPTGQIVERGSNANGRYVRFADGTQICTFSTTHALGSALGTWTLPAAFTDSLYFVTLAMPRASSTNSGFYSTEAYPASAAAAYFKALAVNVSAINYLPETGACKLVAIGRWF